MHIGELTDCETTGTRDLRPTKEVSIIFEPGNSNALATMSETVYEGAETIPNSSTHIQIFISDSVSMSTISDSQYVLGTRAVDGTKLVNNSSIILAHELGHAWGAIKDNFYDRYHSTYRIQIWQRSNLESENKQRSLQVENWQRDRLGLKHRARH